ncbi:MULTISPECIES: hypothetical protein [Myroides]|uniref:hypothetical protein n=1 Tax=Myroides TaxID=76831 RepID=UPI0013039FE3|nr:hypothetical protein [Myroides phaeus]
MNSKSYVAFILLCLGLFLTSCNDKNINTSKAYSTIESYLNEKPIYESNNFQIGKMRLKTTKDKELITFYKQLENEGYISFEEETAKKKWLSKDSIWNVTLKMAEKSHPFVLSQKNDRVKVKTVVYRLDKNSNVQIENNGKKTATANVMLNKEFTPFAFLYKDKTPNTKFITKKFKLKYSEENGWKVTN